MTITWSWNPTLLLLPVKAWLVMLLVGIAHSFDDRVPDFGYWTTLFLAAAFDIYRDTKLEWD